jgi:NAD-dependent SIR2 family protein deacetylase
MHRLIGGTILLIVFLGAGASRVFGIPTMMEFIDIFDKVIKENENDLYNEVKNTFSREDFDLEVLMTILDDLSKDQKELRRTMSPQTSDFLLRKSHEEALKYISNEKIKTAAKETLSKLKGVIREECFVAVHEKVDMILEVYDRFLSLASKAPTSGKHISGDEKSYYPSDLKIFTTNYDTCMETYLNRRQISFTQGIVHRYGYNVFDVDSFNDGNTLVGIFKLHGSVDLFRKNRQIRQLSAYRYETGITHLGEDFGEEVMRYPLEFGGYQHIIESPFLDLFRLFRDRIKNDVMWILVGSSFRDITICSIMNDVLRSKRVSEYPKILFVNPNAQKIIDRLKEWDMLPLAELINKIEAKFNSDRCNTVLPSAMSTT